jgi:hypothetical protein
MANLNIGQAAALSPVTNFNLTDSLMKGAQFGMQQQAAEARALAARMKKNKILSLDMSNIHPTLRKEAEDAAYQTTAAMKISADSGEDPMAVKNIGQFKLNQLQSESKRRFDLEKSNPNDYVMDQEAMTLFSQGKNKEAKSLLESKGYDPQLISAINPEEALFLPKKVKIQEALDKNYGYKNNPGLYEAAEKQKILGFGKERQIFRMNEQAANAAALEMAGNTDVQATVLKDYSTQFKTTLSKVITDNPGIDPNVARGKAFVDVIKDPKNNLLPTGFEDDKPTKGSTFNINMGGREPKYESGFLGPTQLAVKGETSLGSWTGKKEFTFDSEAYILDPQKVGIPKASLRNFDGTTPKTSIGVSDVTSANATSLPINKSNVTIHIDRLVVNQDGTKRQLKVDIKPGQIIDPMLIENGFVDNDKDKIKFVPAALYTGTSKDASGTQVTKSYYSPLFRGARNIYSDNDVKSGMLGETLSHLQALSDQKNKEYGLGGSPKVASQTQAPIKKSGGAPRPKK